MLIIEIQPIENGAHRNQTGKFSVAPSGWITVPPELETEAMSYLPFIVMHIEDDVLIGVEQGEIPPPEPEPEPQPDYNAFLQGLMEGYVHE